MKDLSAFVSISEVYRLFTRTPPFDALHPEQQHRLFWRAAPKWYEPGEILYTPYPRSTQVIILRRGKALVRMPRADRTDPVIDTVRAPAIINAQAIQGIQHDPCIYEALTPCRAWVLDRAEYIKLLTPAQRRRFERESARNKARLYARIRPTAIAYLLRALPRIALTGIAALGFLALPIPLASALAVVAAVAWGTLLIAYLGEYYLVGTNSVEHHHLAIFPPQKHVHSVLLSQVQRVAWRYRGLPGLLFDFGDVQLVTLGNRANLQLNDVARPYRLAHQIEGYVASHRTARWGATHAQMREDLLRALRVLPPLHTEPPQHDRALTLRERLIAYMGEMSSILFPPPRLVRENEIVYRKHWTALIGKLIKPIFSTLLGLAGIAASALLTPIDPRLSVLGYAAGAWALLSFLLLLWRYEDWRNDLYLVSDTKLVEYYRSPLGLRGIRQRTTSLLNIQSVTVQRRGFFDAVFNVGDVIIRTGGMDNELVFERVHDPETVKDDIYQMSTRLAEAEQAREAQRRRQEVAEMLALYDELKQSRPPFAPSASPPTTKDKDA